MILALAAAMAAADAHAPALQLAFDACLIEESFDFPAPDPGLDDEDEEAPKVPGLAETCPALQSAIAASELAPYLPEDWAEQATADKVLLLRSLFAPAAAPEGARPDPAALAAVIEGMQAATQARERTLWQRFKDWLEGLLNRQVKASETSWLEQWVRDHAPSERAVRWIATGLVIVLVLAFAWIVWVELRAAGVFRRSAGAGAGRAVGGAAGPASSRQQPSLATASDEERPALLIALLLEQLRRLGRVQDRHSMTHRELLQAVRLDAADESDTFRALVGASERLRYAAVAPAVTTLRAIVDQGMRLLDRLSQSPRSAT